MGDFLVVVGLIGVAVAAVALVRGRLEWAGMRNRRTAVFGFVVAAGLLLSGTALATPSAAPSPLAAKGPILAVVDTAPTVMPLPTTTAPPTTTVRPITTTRHTTHRTTTRPTTTTTRAPTLSCAASVSDSSPAGGSTVEIVVRTGVPGAQVTATAVFGPATSSQRGSSGSDGIADIPFHLSRWMYGYPVVIRVQVTDGGENRYCGTILTPWPN